jgi:hypothetical protein
MWTTCPPSSTPTGVGTGKGDESRAAESNAGARGTFRPSLSPLARPIGSHVVNAIDAQLGLAPLPTITLLTSKAHVAGYAKMKCCTVSELSEWTIEQALA